MGNKISKSIKTIEKRIKIGSVLVKELNLLFTTSFKIYSVSRTKNYWFNGTTYYYSAYKELEGTKIGKTKHTMKEQKCFY